MKPIIFFFILITPSLAIDFLFDSFNGSRNTTDVILIGDALVDAGVISLTDESNQLSLGRAYYTSKLAMKTQPNSTTLRSFSTSFVFSILPEIATSPGFGLAFVLTNFTSPPGALASQYFGLFTDSANPQVAPILAVEFDAGKNTEFSDPDGNHIGIDLNNIKSIVTETAGYYNSSGGFVPVQMRTGQNIHAWIEFAGAEKEINVTIAPVGVSKPSRPLLSYRDPVIANYVSSDMYVGFSASTTNWVETQRLLAWSLSDVGVAREINVTNLPIFLPESSSSSLSHGAIAGIVVGCGVVLIILAIGCYFLWINKKSKDRLEEEEIEDWELEYWPHRFSYEELSQATKDFSKDELLGSGGFGKVYRGVLGNDTEIAVKCVNHDSKQGLREFMAEISSMGRLQHKNLVPMKGWCRKGNELMLVYEYMPNGSLHKWIFGNPEKTLTWCQRKRVLTDVAEGLNYLHHGWDQVVVHRDIKSSNVLLDGEMRGRLGDFGLAKLYARGDVPNTTRVVGTLGYLAPELARAISPTSASDVYSFGVVVLEVVCGSKPIKVGVEEEVVLVDRVRELYVDGRILEASDERVRGENGVEDMLKLGLVCCHPNPQKRPNMREVVAVLLGADAVSLPTMLVQQPLRGGDGSIENATLDGGATPEM